MPGLCYQYPTKTPHGPQDYTCNCKSCPCRNLDTKRCPGSKKSTPPNGIVFQLPRLREPFIDTYSHTVYRKEFCSPFLMKQHALLAHHRKTSQRPKAPPILQPEKFACQTTTGCDFRKYNPKDRASCKAKFPRTKRKEDFYYSPGEYSCTLKFPDKPVSHEDYCPRTPIPSTFKKKVRECDRPPFEGITCYDRDYRAPPLQAYSRNRNGRKRVVFD